MQDKKTLSDTKIIDQTVSTLQGLYQVRKQLNALSLVVEDLMVEQRELMNSFSVIPRYVIFDQEE